MSKLSTLSSTSRGSRGSRGSLRALGTAVALAWGLAAGPARAQAAPDAPPVEVAPLPPGPAPAPAPAPAPMEESAPPPSQGAQYAPPPPEEEVRGPTARDYVVAYYTGFQLGISPGIIFPTNGGDPGFLLSLYGGYGIEAGSVIVIPGLHLTGAWPPDVFIGTVTPTGKLVFPLGAFAPYIEAGAGPGYVSKPEKTGLAVRAGLGFSVHPSRRFAIGLGASYETIMGTDIAFLGPVLILSF